MCLFTQNANGTLQSLLISCTVKKSFCSCKREVVWCEEGWQAQRQAEWCFLTDDSQQSVAKLVCCFVQSAAEAGWDVPIDYLLLATEEMPAAVRKSFEVCDDIVKWLIF